MYYSVRKTQRKEQLGWDLKEGQELADKRRGEETHGRRSTLCKSSVPGEGMVAPIRKWQGEQGKIKPERSAGAQSGTGVWDTAGSAFIFGA